MTYMLKKKTLYSVTVKQKPIQGYIPKIDSIFG